MEIKTCEFVPENSQGQENRNSFFERIQPHLELIAALLSGLIVLIAWLYKGSIPHSLFVILHLAAFVIGGFAKAKEGIEDTIADKELNVELLMILAAIGSAVIGYWTEGAVLIFIFALSGALETYTLNKSNKEISSLMDLQPEHATLIKDGKEQIIPASELSVDDIILVRASERIPADGTIIRGATSIDERAITGESIPVQRQTNEDVYASTVALDGTITVKITKPASETLFQKIINMVQSAQDEKSPSQLFIERFEGTYVKIVLLVVAIMMFLPYFLFGWTLSESIYRAMVLLVVASPCALVASIMPATLSAISNSAKHGVLFKGGVHIENLGNLKAIAFDKTGTLTNGTPVVTDAYFTEKMAEDEIIATVAAIEKESTHPLALAITAYGEKALNQENIFVDDMKTVSGKGVTGFVDGVKWEIGNMNFVGEDLAKDFHNGIAQDLANEGKTIVCAKANEEIVAVFALKDTVRESAKKAIELLKNKGIEPVMLTGDNELTAKAIAEEAGIDRYIASCLPEEKVNYIKKLEEKHGNVAMVGDGINDAPALATANTGIAMGEGTDVALETADVVLMKNDLEKITSAIDLSSRMNRVVKQNIIFSLSVIGILIISNFFQIIDLPLGVIGHEGSTILVILNGLRLLK
ncbi:heavy metal translocating P-type ATPase [Cerasibacillus terrae]|uniref:Heavy metal translocating P-type ATPase n=2 Tax=Cerasibacillus terrae TaxID=2498845 RepID=A0A5C8NXY2_9BACI|nr:heavy metal translocating P-type ATPase [Cerasibacillus terrae]TXL65833.1 heavy metal translocating P-type ATPase [Cerasibacillus terrae]